ncbi:MAG: hypothetical protein ACKOLA_08155 [Spartobacteria bacterium]
MSNQPDQTPEKVEAALRECRQLTEKILLGLTSKRSDEEWEFFKNRTIEMFRQKGLFKNEATSEPTQSHPEPKTEI